MMVVARRQQRHWQTNIWPVDRHLQAEQVALETNSSVEICYAQMDVTDAHIRMNRQITHRISLERLHNH